MVLQDKQNIAGKTFVANKGTLILLLLVFICAGKEGNWQIQGVFVCVCVSGGFQNRTFQI